VFQLDALAVSLTAHDTSNTPTADPGAGKAKTDSGTDEELDLLDFLDEKPYFDERDLGGAGADK